MDVGSVLLDILVVLIAAKLAAEVAERINVPAVVGEIVAGVIIGPSILGFVGSNETLSVLGELGVILLLLGVGMEMDIADLGAVGRSALSVASIGVDRADGRRLRGGVGAGAQQQPVAVHRRRARGHQRRASPRACSATSARWRRSKRARCSARPWPTTCSGS